MIKVVVVEDEVLLRKDIIMTTPWDKFGCEVIGEAADGLEGQALIRKLRPHIVITDIRMPGVDGISLMKNLQDIQDIEYIIISGYSEFEYAIEAVKLGAKNYLLKPIDDEELHQTIQKIVKEIHNKNSIRKIKMKAEDIVNNNSLKFDDVLRDVDTINKGGYAMDVIEYVKKYYMKDISIKDVSEYLYISESYLSRIFKKETNYTFVEYLTYYRVKKSIELMNNHQIRIYEVANMVGYKDYRYFSAIFKKLVGVNPTEYRNWLLNS